MHSLLIVDDDPAIRTMFASALASLGECAQAGTAIEAMRLLGQKTFHAILLDLHMPGVDGFALLKQLSTHKGLNQDAPVVVVTADVSDEARVRALRRAVFFVTKPVQISQLVALVALVLRRAGGAPPATTKGG